MELTWSAEQRELRDALITFARKRLPADVAARDASGCFSRDAWQLCAEFGIQGLPFPAEHGGGDLDALTTVMAMEALGYAWKDNGLLFALGAQMWSVQMPIYRFGSAAQQERYLPGLCSGDLIGAHGMTEPDSGSDAFDLRTVAERRGDAYILNGAKTFVTSAPVADLFLVFATIGRDRGVLGITGFLIDAGTPGLSVGGEIHKMGLRTSPMAEVILENCRIPSHSRLGKEGRGAAIFNDSMEWERGCIMAGCLGAMERQLEQCITHARQRRQFGRPIGEFQSVANRIVTMKVRLEAARFLVYRAALTKQRTGSAAAESAMAKLFLSEAWVESCQDAIQVHGGYGYTTEYELERDLRDAVGGRLYSGTSDIQRTIIARQLGL